MAFRWSNRKSSLIFLVLIALGFMVYHIMYLEMRHELPHGVKLISYLDWKWTEPLDPDQACQFPNPDPFDSSVLEYIEEARELSCRRSSALTFIGKDGFLRFNFSALHENGYSNTSLHCFYQAINRASDSDDKVYFGPEQPFKESVPITVEYINVWCKNWLNWPVYTNIHAHPRNLTSPPSPRVPGDRRINVAIFGLDSLSRLNALRHLPKTYQYLTKKMGAIVLEGLVKVGDNTYPNLVAILSGRKTYTDEIVYKPVGEFHDDWPLIWKNFSRAGYVTMLAEDLPEYNVFNYLASGFRESPTDHYLRPFWLALERSFTYKFSSNFCYGEMPKHVLQIEYVYQFLEKYKHVPYFAFSFLTEISHDYMNQMGVGDDDFESFLRRIYEGGLLNDTFFVFMGDHGHRFSPIRTTNIGRMEESMPFAAVFVPHSLRKKFPHIMRTLRINSRRLLSMFDFYDTLVDILRYGVDNTRLGSNPRPVLFRGQSLFTEIPKNRTCENVGIPQRYCICDQEEPLPLAHPRVIASSRYLVEHLNGMTENLRNICSVWSLSETRSAMSIKLSGEEDTRTCTRITIETKPGGGLFEGFVCFQHMNGIYYTKEDVGRLNMYRGQDWCLAKILTKQTDYLRKYCYCK